MVLPWKALIQSIGVQLSGLAFATGYFAAAPGPSPVIGLCIASVTAALAAVFLRMSIQWVVFNLLLPAGAAAAVSGAVPSYLFLAGFLLLLSLHLPAVWTHVPYYPTPAALYDEISSLLPENEPFRFAELGCGTGALLAAVAKRRTNGSFEGVEIGPAPFLLSAVRALLRANVAVKFQSFWTMDFGRYGYLYAFLSPAPMDRLWEKFEREAKPGTVLISNSFEAPARPERVIELSNQRGGRLYLYRK